jgi:hypothetical protein
MAGEVSQVFHLGVNVLQTREGRFFNPYKFRLPSGTLSHIPEKHSQYPDRSAHRYQL